MPLYSTSTTYSSASDLSKPNRRKRATAFPDNHKIATALWTSPFAKKFVKGTAVKMKNTYRLDESIIEEVKRFALLRVFEANWHRTLYKDGIRPRKADADCARLVKKLRAYCVFTIRNAMIDGLRWHFGRGLKGLTGKPMKELPFVSDIPNPESDAPEDPTAITEVHTPDALISPDIEREVLGHEIVEIAKSILTVGELLVVELAFGFDGSDSRSPHQIAEELETTRPEVEKLLNGALEKIRCQIAKSNGASQASPSHQTRTTQFGTTAICQPSSSTVESGTANPTTISSLTKTVN